MDQSTQNSLVIAASPQCIYEVLTDPVALETWQVPGDMKGKVHEFNLEIGGEYKMSLYYPETGNDIRGKTSLKEDRFFAKFIELSPHKKIIEAIYFDTDDPGFSGEMLIEIDLEPIGNQTKVSFLFRNIPAGIRPEDNEAGTLSSLEKLAKYVE